MSGELAPGFLIASPPLGDPNFERTVVLLALHGPRGALGFVINRVAPLKLGEVMGLAGYGAKASASLGAVLVGGPVEPGSGWVLCGKPELTGGAEGAIDVTDAVKITSSRVAFDVLAKDLEVTPPAAERRLILLGYSGWGPGQLEGEIAHGAWLPAPFDEKVLFDVEADQKWEAAYALLGLSPAMTIGMRTVGDA
jgi:putative transcriptional regulator